MNQKIVTHPNKGLFEKTRDIPVDQIKSDTYSQIASAMFEIMEKEGGIGLSANQVGLPLNMCVIAVHFNDKLIMLNPRIIKTGKKMSKGEEGCLSLPGCSGTVNRYEEVTVEYENVTGETETREATGILARCIQHEIDHLQGLLFINRLGEYNKSKVLKQYHKARKANGRLT